ncbi:MAG: acetyl/propionyl/methylcrotonyl-CoA carboxylase subunit alpha [Halieaceae bacterium]
MFNKILIANRGEIACRIIRTAHHMGISTVAVYSEADSNSMHVAMADEAVAIGPAPARESYLCIDKVIAAAQRTGAEAIHPGYGFLSENPEFCRACHTAGIVFIGPPVKAIEAMGSKSAAKQIMGDAGVPLLPGYHGAAQEPALLLAEAEKIGFPVLLKAIAGGGGKGMRKVYQAADFEQELQAAQREASSSFGNDEMLVEKFLGRPRHVEIQVFCDQQGNGVYLSERDCSVQRRHQKVIEEAPAFGLSEDQRSAMGIAAVTAAQAIDYVGAGTVEFLLDEDGSFYFMEMNTRLQVEHPVTEMITGEDLVEWQLRVAAGEALPRQQDQIRLNGHSFEARIYAEDPDRDFLPATGTLAFMRTPEENEQVRVDTGVRQGDEVSIHYDPMIAKLIVWDTDRNSALRRLSSALSRYRVAGVTTNIDFLYNIATSAPFRDAEIDTSFIEQHEAILFHQADVDEGQELALASLLLLLQRRNEARQHAAGHGDPHSPWHANSAWRMNEPHLHQIRLSYREREVEVQAEQVGTEQYRLSFEQHSTLVSGEFDGEQLSADIDGFRQKLSIAEHDGSYSAYRSDGAFRFAEQQPDLGEAAQAGPGGNPRAPMTGVMGALLCEVGQWVEADTALLVMEAMKMEHTIRAPMAGKVTEFYFQPGDLVDGNAELLNFECEE